MKRTASLLLAAALWGTTTGCYCMPYGGGMGFPLGCPPTQPTQMMPTPVPSTGYNMIDAVPVAGPVATPAATPVMMMPTPITTPTPVVVESLPPFR